MMAKRGTIQERLAWQSIRVGSCIEFTGCCDPGGYGMIQYRGIKSTHRLAYEIHKGEIPDGMHVMHSCDNRKCMNPEHLSLGTNQDNVNDKVSKNRQCKGVAHPRAKLNPEKAFEIRWYAAMGRTQRDIAKEYGIAHTLVGKIVRCEMWKPECHD